MRYSYEESNTEMERSLILNNNIKKKNYSNCPLKKRPVHFIKDYDEDNEDFKKAFIKKETSIDEPENLSTKPQDLSSKAPSTGIALHTTPSGVIIPHPLIALPPHFLSKASSRPLEPLNLNTSLENDPWQQHHYLPFYHYAGASAFEPPSPPRNNLYHPLSPASSTSSAFHSLSPYTSLPEDLSSPGSVGSSNGSTSSIASIKKKCKESSPRYQCNFCSKSYSTYSGLSKHQQFHCAANEDSLAKKTFSCKYCEKIYVSLGALKMHIRTHTLPCKCEVCGKAFSRPWLLQGHIRTHTGEKPFSCQHCNRAFADRSNLRAHLQTHSDVKKYSCTNCSKTFSRMSLLTKHLDGGCCSNHSLQQVPSPSQQYQCQSMY